MLAAVNDLRVRIVVPALIHLEPDGSATDSVPDGVCSADLMLEPGSTGGLRMANQRTVALLCIEHSDLTLSSDASLFDEHLADNTPRARRVCCHRPFPRRDRSLGTSPPIADMPNDSTAQPDRPRFDAACR